MTRKAPLIAAVFAAAMLVGCGVPAERSPREITPPRGPYGALGSPTPAATESGSVPEKLYLVKDGTLVAVQRRVHSEPTVTELVADLLAGPTDTERAAGLTSALLGATAIGSVQVTDAQAVVQLASDLKGTSRNDEVLAIGQLVCTLTTRKDISGVSFTLDGQRVDVPGGDGSLLPGPLTAADYTTLIAKP